MTRKQMFAWAKRTVEVQLIIRDNTLGIGPFRELIFAHWWTCTPGGRRKRRSMGFQCEDQCRFTLLERLAIARCIADIAGVEPPKE